MVLQSSDCVSASYQGSILHGSSPALQQFGQRLSVSLRCCTRLQRMWPPAPRHDHYWAQLVFNSAAPLCPESQLPWLLFLPTLHLALPRPLSTRSPTSFYPSLQKTSPCTGWHPPPPSCVIIFPFNLFSIQKSAKHQQTLLYRLLKSAPHLRIICTTHTSGPNHCWRKERTGI